MIILLSIVALILAIGLYYRQIYSRFRNHGVKNPQVIAPFGNMLHVILRIDHLADNLVRMYKQFPEERFIGRYDFAKPTIIVRDIDLIKKITVKDFEYFLDHRGLTDETVEPLFARNLFSLRGDEWRDMRSILSPAFTSSKIRLMVPFMQEVGEEMIRALKKNIKESDTPYIEVDCKDLTSRFANDVIACCAFGLKVDSYTDRDNHFYKMGRNAATFKFKQMVTILAGLAFPTLAKKLKLTLFSNKTSRFFLDLMLNMMIDREIHNTIRYDMIHLLMKAKKEWSDNDLVAQALLFFIAGFDTVSSVMSFALHELAIHPEIQEKLAKEIKDTDVKHDGKLDYNTILHMPCLDMVISEVLRLWPPAVVLDRQCVKDYNLGTPNKKSTKDYIIHKGENIKIPVWGIHRDAKFFPEPNKFDPDRFSDENKHMINPMTYMPFGLGPRHCIASRFSLCELKVLVYYILRHMELSLSEKTILPVNLCKDTFDLHLLGGHWLRFKSRS